MTENIRGATIGADGLCNFCRDHRPFVPHGEDKLLKILSTARRRHRSYDALVPLSGGRDSTYVLYLAVKKYGLNVLAYTYDNGFMSGLARQNIQASLDHAGVDHIWVRHDSRLIKELYRVTLMQSGEICGICGVGIERSMLKLSEAYKIPLILLGHTPNEANSFTSEDIYDQKRIKAILARSEKLDAQMLRRYLVYPGLNFINTYVYTKMGRFGKKVHILYYLDNPTESEIGKIISMEMGWTEPDQSAYTRHFDCIAEPFTNYIRERRFGSSRRIPQLSNLVRNHEISRETALKIEKADATQQLPAYYGEVLSALNLSDNDVENISRIPPGVFSQEKALSNKIFTQVRKVLKKAEH